MKKKTVMDPESRIRLAQRKIDSLVDNYIELVNINANNRFLTYSNIIVSQVGKSRAAHAFNYLQSSVFRYEIIQLMTIFDPCIKSDLQKISIPAVINLIDDDEVIQRLGDKAFAYNSGRLNYETAENERILCIYRLRFCIKWVKRAEKYPRVVRLMNFRHKHLAHTLEITKMEQKTTVQNPRYGDERKLLICAKIILNALYLSISNTGYDFKGSKNIADRNAHELWSRCRFDDLQ